MFSQFRKLDIQHPLLPNIISFLASEAAVSTYEFGEEGLGLPIAVGFVCLSVLCGGGDI